MTEAGETSEIGHTHRDTSTGWLRASVFGVTDGLVSNFALVAGVAGAGAETKSVALAGLAGLVGGAFSMAAGEYVSVSSQNESTLAEVAKERHELTHNFDAELAELADMYVEKGLEPELAAEVAGQLSKDLEQALVIHTREELGVDPDALPSPWVAAESSFVAFVIGAFVPLLPYLLGASSIAVSAVLSLSGLFVAGTLAAQFTARSALFSGTRQLLLGALAAAVTFGVGALFGTTIS